MSERYACSTVVRLRQTPPAAALPPSQLGIVSTTQPTMFCSSRALTVLRLRRRIGQSLTPLVPGGGVGAAARALRATAGDSNRHIKIITTTTTRRFRRRSLLGGAVDRPDRHLGLTKTTGTYPFRRPPPAASCARGAKNSRAKMTAPPRGETSDTAGPPTSLLERHLLGHGRDKFRVRLSSVLSPPILCIRTR